MRSPSPLTGEGWGEGEKQGFALVSALAFLLVITLLGVSLFLGVNLQQKAAGNSLQKTRALELAKTVTLSAERWLATAPDTELGTRHCSGNAAGQYFRVCAFPPNNPSQPAQWGAQWGGGATKVSVKSLKQGHVGGHDVYYNEPGVWISFLGLATMGSGKLYRIHAYAWGGNEKSLVVTETVFYVGKDMQSSTPARDLGS